VPEAPRRRVSGAPRAGHCAPQRARAARTAAAARGAAAVVAARGAGRGGGGRRGESPGPAPAPAPGPPPCPPGRGRRGGGGGPGGGTPAPSAEAGAAGAPSPAQASSSRGSRGRGSAESPSRSPRRASAGRRRPALAARPCQALPPRLPLQPLPPSLRPPLLQRLPALRSPSPPPPRRRATASSSFADARQLKCARLLDQLLEPPAAVGRRSCAGVAGGGARGAAPGPSLRRRRRRPPSPRRVLHIASAAAFLRPGDVVLFACANTPAALQRAVTGCASRPRGPRGGRALAGQGGGGGGAREGARAGAGPRTRGPRSAGWALRAARPRRCPRRRPPPRTLPLLLLPREHRSSSVLHRLFGTLPEGAEEAAGEEEVEHSGGGGGGRQGPLHLPAVAEGQGGAEETAGSANTVEDAGAPPPAAPAPAPGPLGAGAPPRPRWGRGGRAPPPAEQPRGPRRRGHPPRALAPAGQHSYTLQLFESNSEGVRCTPWRSAWRPTGTGYCHSIVVRRLLLPFEEVLLPGDPATGPPPPLAPPLGRRALHPLRPLLRHVCAQRQQ